MNASEITTRLDEVRASLIELRREAPGIAELPDEELTRLGEDVAITIVALAELSEHIHGEMNDPDRRGRS